MKYLLFSFFLFFSLILNSVIYSQSLGVSVGSAYVSTYQAPVYSSFSKSFDIPLKNVFIEYSQDLLPDFRVSIATGYGWNNFNSQLQHIDPNMTYFEYTFKLESNGIPIELGFEYHKNLNADSTIESFIGIGIGYCNYKSTLKTGYNTNYNNGQSRVIESDFSTKGFSQYLNIGMRINITNKISCYFEMKKMILNNLETSGDYNVIKISNNEPYSQDYAPSNGLFDVGLDFGLDYRL